MVSLGLGAHFGRHVDRRLARAITEADRDNPHWRLVDLLAHREVVPFDPNTKDPIGPGDILAEAWDTAGRGQMMPDHPL